MPRMMRRIGRAAVGTAVIAGTAGAVRHHQEQKYAAQDAQQQQAAYDQQMAAQPAAAPAPAAAVDPQTAQLENLANLHAQGILTDEEYAAAKAKALGI
jgi:Short C-terminal domain